MSDNVLRFIPTDANWTPSQDNAAAAAELLQGMVASSAEITTSFPDEITFFDPGGNWSGVECPACGADAESWFWEAFDEAASKGFMDLSVTTPCCSKEASLNTLHYKWPAGFGRFALEALNPGIADTTSEQVSDLAQCLGSPLTKIWVHI